MTDNLQLQTNRLTNASAGNLIDDSVADIENALSVTFGITKDTPLSQVMSISAAGNVTMVGDLTLSGAPTNNLHCATKKYVDDNATGGGGYNLKARRGVVILAALGDDLIAFSDNSIELEEGSDAQFDQANPTKFVCKSAGDYFIMGEVRCKAWNLDGYFHPFQVYGGLELNGNPIIIPTVSFWNDNVVVYEAGFTYAVLWTLAEDDYIEIRAGNNNDEEARFYGNFSWIQVA